MRPSSLFIAWSKSSPNCKDVGSDSAMKQNTYRLVTTKPCMVLLVWNIQTFRKWTLDNRYANIQLRISMEKEKPQKSVVLLSYHKEKDRGEGRVSIWPSHLTSNLLPNKIYKLDWADTTKSWFITTLDCESSIGCLIGTHNTCWRLVMLTKVVSHCAQLKLELSDSWADICWAFGVKII